ncbi:MAG: type II toxin-antitoxin system prevent-host-death family antitoxin [Myxococcota bacterium]|nr:type II toxin-antitoxin system prevent-host-death family antitoxin [Myxococcota bacterium]
MIVNTVTEAKATLSALLDRVGQGEEVIISRAGKPIAVLRPYQPDEKPRRPGRLKNSIHIAPDFDELPLDIAQSLGMVEK